ncbi:MAG: hypothetical protein AB7V56_03795 [Candidatus Nitrosocosmicus sp.]
MVQKNVHRLYAVHICGCGDDGGSHQRIKSKKKIKEIKKETRYEKQKNYERQKISFHNN